MKNNNIDVNSLLDLSSTIAKDLFDAKSNVWDVLDNISDYIMRIGPTLNTREYTEIDKNVWVANSAIIAPLASIHGPCIIGPYTEVRHCAYIRGSVLIGAFCVVGNSSEIKNSILFDKAQVPHYNYVGDSLLGYASHMGAGAITSNVKGNNTAVCIKNGENSIKTGRRKFGAIIGDYGEIGCGSVLNPGTIIGRNTQIYPLSSVRGIIPENSIYKSADNIAKKS